MKKVAILSAVLLLASVAFADNNFFKGSLDQALAKAKADGKKVLLDFNSYT